MAAAAIALVGLYVGVTFVQVWWATGQDDARPSEAIIVLGAAQYDGEPSPVLEERLDHAHVLWDEGMAPMIVVTGGRQPGDRFTEATASYNHLRDLGVPDDDILKEVDGTNTWEQLAASARFLAERDVTDVILVTDDYHAYRVEAIAGELGLERHRVPGPLDAVDAHPDEAARQGDRRGVGRSIHRLSPPGQPRRRSQLLSRINEFLAAQAGR